jgi:fatty-acid peroxygenase
MIDRTVQLAADPYLHLSRRRERSGSDIYPLRVLGHETMCLVGEAGTRLFYDPESFDRRGVMPPNVQQTLFGDAAVHLLDGPEHRVRKAMFTSALGPVGRARLLGCVETEWERATERWQGREVVLFDEAAHVLCAGVHAWAGLPLADEAVPATAADMVAMVDGFATLGPRYLRARRARGRQERRLADLVERARAGRLAPDPGTPFDQVTRHRDLDGALLDPHTAAVELLNLLRPTVAIAWFVAYSAHALVHWPDERRFLEGGGAGSAHAVAFADEVRRFYPFAPLLAARAVRDVTHEGVTVRRGGLGVLDVFGQNHHADLWPDPWTFSTARHVGRERGLYDLIPQGGGDAAEGHRCPGEPATVDIVAALAVRLVRLPYVVPQQDLRVTRHRAPARIRSGMVLAVE